MSARADRGHDGASPAGLLAALLSFAAAETLVIFGVRRLTLSAAELPAAVRAASQPLFLADLLFLFFVGTLLLILLVRLVKSRIFFQAIFLLAFALGVWSYLGLFLPPRSAAVFTALAAAVFFVWPIVAVRNSLLVLSVAGAAVLLGGSTTVAAALVLLIVLSFYDIIAVYRTGHMVRLARELAERGAAFALFLPAAPERLMAPAETVKGKGDFLLLGTGDLALPSIFVAAVARGSTALALLSAGGTLAGLILMYSLFIRQKTVRPMPALPPIAAGAIIGYLAGLIIL